MHVNRRRVLGIVVPVLLVSAAAVTTTSLTARAQTYKDTALSAGPVTDETFGGSSLMGTTKYSAANDGDVIILSGTGVASWSLHGTVPQGVAMSGTSAGVATISYQGSADNQPEFLVADATDANGNVEALSMPVIIWNNYVYTDGTQLVDSPIIDLTDSNTSAGNVTFSAHDPGTYDPTITESDLPAGLPGGSNALYWSNGTAAPGTYSGVKVIATNSQDGQVLIGTFTLTISANTVTVSPSGDEVNKSGAGFDVFRNHDDPGALIVGWPASKSDPGTQFIRNKGSHAGAYQFEYAPNDSGSGLCVSDPGGSQPADPLRDGLILRYCNSSPYQQFIPQSNGTLKNLATGLYVHPDGKGAQLRGEPSRASSGASAYTWKTSSSLPTGSG
jgi:hypothetical protein